LTPFAGFNLTKVKGSAML